MNEANHRIESPDLAHEMALAEKPYRVIAQYALELGDAEGYQTAVENSERAAIQSGKAYLAKLSLDLSFYDTIPHIEAVKPSYVRATEEDMIDFASESGRSQREKAMMKKVWNALRASQSRKFAEKHAGAFVSRPTKYRRNELIEVHLTQSLVDDAIQLRNIGEATQALLREYYDARRTAMDAEQDSELG